MSRRARVPKFGSWDSNEGTAPHFTELFEDARAASKGSRNHLNDSNPGDLPPRHPENEGRPREHGHSRRSSRENAEGYGVDASGRRQIEPPAHRIQVDNSRYVPQKTPSDNVRRAGNEAENLDNGHHLAQRSPMHQHSRHGTNRVGSPAWERRSTEGSGTPGRSRLRNAEKNSQQAEKAAALPKFGAWDANDPASGDGFTMIFNNARNEKKAGGAAHVPPLGFDGRTDKDLYPGRTATTQSRTSKFLCCFQPTVT